MRVRELLTAALLVGCIAGCPGSASSPPPSPTSPPPATEPATPAEAPPPASDPTVPAPAGATLLADGQPCFDNISCNSGVCEGQGCTQADPGTCMPKLRACTKDLREYCGCNGATFQTSGSCPGQRYASKGACAGGAP